MKGWVFTGKALAGLSMIILINLAIRHCFDPSWYRGNMALSMKMQDYLKIQDSVNTVFVGSSCIFWNLDPVIFDSIMPPDWQIKSFNLGSSAFTPPETYWFVHELIRRYPGKIKNIILELREPLPYNEKNRHTLRERYWLTPRWYSYIIKSELRNHDLPANERFYTMLFTTESYAEKLFNVGYFNTLLNQDAAVKQNRNKKISQYRKNGMRGMLPIDEGHERIKTPEFLKDTTMLAKMASAQKYLRQKNDPGQLNQMHLKAIQDLIKQCRQENIHLVFLFHPKTTYRQLPGTIGLMKHIPAGNLLDLADPDSFPELYLVENSLNNNHFNRKGTRVFTQLAGAGFIGSFNFSKADKPDF
jgi:hypothetical protein